MIKSRRWTVNKIRVSSKHKEDNSKINRLLVVKNAWNFSQFSQLMKFIWKPNIQKKSISTKNKENRRNNLNLKKMKMMKKIQMRTIPKKIIVKNHQMSKVFRLKTEWCSYNEINFKTTSMPFLDNSEKEMLSQAAINHLNSSCILKIKN